MPDADLGVVVRHAHIATRRKGQKIDAAAFQPGGKAFGVEIASDPAQFGTGMKIIEKCVARLIHFRFCPRFANG